MSFFDYNGTNLSAYRGKKFSILGDSISSFAGYVPEGNPVWYDGNNNGVSEIGDIWWKKLIDALGANLLVNESWSGCRVTTTNGETSAGCMNRCVQLHSGNDNPDVVIVYLGINDFNNGVGLGSYSGAGDFPDVTTTFREAYAIMLNKILTKYPTAELWVCTLPYCEKTGEHRFPEQNRNGEMLAEWNCAILELADLFGVKVLEHAKCGLTYQNLHYHMGDYASGDGLHPNAAGHSLLANNAIRQMDPMVRKRYI